MRPLVGRFVFHRKTNAAALALAAVWMSGGCGSNAFPVSLTDGRVICDGQPVANAQVFFEPLVVGTSVNVGKPGFAFTDANGAFALSTYGRNDGAVIGKHRVRVAGDSSIKCDCEMNSEKDLMQIEILAGQSNSVEISLPKKDPATRRRPRSRGEMADAADARFDNQ